MLKKTLTWTDIDDKEVTEEFHFSVSRGDLIDFMIEKPEMEEKLQKLAVTMDGRSIVGLLKEFIILAVGRRPEGSRQFVKTPEITNDFRFSGAYDTLLWELANDPEQANNFMEHVFPTALLDEIKKQGSLEELRAKVAKGPKGETIVDLPDKDWAAKDAPANPLVEAAEAEAKNPQSFVELATPGATIDTIEGEVVSDPKTAFPGSLPEALSSQQSTHSDSEHDRPAWLKEMREPTSKELIEMPKEEMQLAFRLKEEGKLAKSA